MLNTSAVGPDGITFRPERLNANRAPNSRIVEVQDRHEGEGTAHLEINNGVAWIAGRAQCKTHSKFGAPKYPFDRKSDIVQQKLRQQELAGVRYGEVMDEKTPVLHTDAHPWIELVEASCGHR